MTILRAGNRFRRHTPVLSHDIITRDRLIKLLERQRPLTLVVAPAGYGKTTLVADWLRRTHHPSVWLTLRTTDDSVPSFVSSLLDAVQARFAGCCLETRTILDGASQPPPAVLARHLIDELAELPDRFVLVFDDYHMIHNMVVQQVIADLLEDQPPQMRLVMLTRHTPPLPLPSLRAYNKVTEIRARDLLFSCDEVRDFLDLALDAVVEAQEVEALERLTEGWAAALRLVSLLPHQDRAAAVGHFQLEQGTQFALEYLADEVLDRLPPLHQEFLARTAILEQVSAPLGAALMDDCGEECCQVILDDMARSELFVFALEGEGRWYRFHHLLRSLTLQRTLETMGVNGVARLHLLAARWLADHGQLDAAIKHAVKSGDVQAVAVLVRDYRQQVLARSEWARIAEWRQLIPQAMFQQHPQILILDAWEASHRDAVPDIVSCVDAVEALLAHVPLDADDERLLRSELDGMRCQVLFWRGEHEETVRLGLRSLAAAPLQYERARGNACMFTCASLNIMGKRTRADALLTVCLDEAIKSGLGAYAVYALCASASLEWMRADVVTMQTCGDQLFTLAQAANHLDGMVAGLSMRGYARYAQNDLAGALADLRPVTEDGYTAPSNIHGQSVIALAATLLALGRHDEAIQTVRAAIEFHRELGNSRIVGDISGYLAVMDVRHGRAADALRWLAMRAPRPWPVPMPHFAAEPLYHIQVLLGLGTQETLAEAAEQLASLAAYLETHSNTRLQIECWALQAFCQDRAGAEDEALELLERAVEQALAGGAIRLLADLDFLIGPLLDRLAARGRSRSRTQAVRIRRAALVFAPTVPVVAPQSGANGAQPVPDTQSASHNRDGQAPLAAAGTSGRLRTIEEALTRRELEVLQILMMDRPTNKEIARELNITVETVKRHMNHVFQKLHVENRRQALVEARRLGLLPPALTPPPCRNCISHGLSSIW